MVISQTPLRISFAGGGTDLKEFWKSEPGNVLSSSIDKYVFVVIKERFDDLIVLNYTARETVHSVSDIKHDLIRESMLKTGINSGVEITTLADVPSEGSGLGSSSSITVGLLHAFYAFQEKQVTTEQLAQEACEIEIDILSKPIGKQDQYIAAYGGFREITFHSNDTIKVETLRNHDSLRREFGSNLLLFYTDITRQSSDILAKQKAETHNKMQILRQIRDMVPHVRDVLENDTCYHEVGRILHNAWGLKKQLSGKVSNPVIDEMYHRARAAGAVGGKICGAGGGGFLLVYVPIEKQSAVCEALKDYREFSFVLEPDGSKIIFNKRRSHEQPDDQ